MKTQNTKWWLGAALLTVAGLSGRASATLPAETSAYLNITVTINASLSVKVDGALSSTYTSTAWDGTPNKALTSLSTATVTNDSTALSSKWALSTDARSMDVSTLPTIETWANAASTATVIHDQYGAQAVFGSSATAVGNCPAAGAAVWNSGTIAPPLTTSPQLYANNAAFADTSDALLNASGSTANPDNAAFSQMYVGSKRALCWRLIMPSSTFTTHTQEVQVIVTAIPAS